MKSWFSLGLSSAIEVSADLALFQADRISILQRLSSVVMGKHQTWMSSILAYSSTSGACPRPSRPRADPWHKRHQEPRLLSTIYRKTVMRTRARTEACHRSTSAMSPVKQSQRTTATVAAIFWITRSASRAKLIAQRRSLCLSARWTWRAIGMALWRGAAP